MTERQCARRATILLGGFMLVAVAAGPAVAAGCSFEPQGEGRVAAVIDARSFRLQDGREIRLAGIEPVPEKLSAEKVPAAKPNQSDKPMITNESTKPVRAA